MTQKIRKAVFPVAGLGTRFLPATKTIPKEMLTVVDAPVLQHVVDEAREAGIEHFIFVTGRGKAVIEDYFDINYELEDTLKARGKSAAAALLERQRPAAGATSFTRQQAPLGLGHAVWCAREIVGDEPFAVLLPDMVTRPGAMASRCLAQCIEAYEKHGGNVIAVEEVPAAETHKYGIVSIGADHGATFEITGMVEKPPQGTAPSNQIISGRYVLGPEIFKILETQGKGAGGESSADRRHDRPRQASKLSRRALRRPHLRLRLQARLPDGQRRFRPGRRGGVRSIPAGTPRPPRGLIRSGGRSGKTNRADERHRKPATANGTPVFPCYGPGAKGLSSPDGAPSTGLRFRPGDPHHDHAHPLRPQDPDALHHRDHARPASDGDG